MQICSILDRILEMAIVFAFDYGKGTHVATTFLGFPLKPAYQAFRKETAMSFVAGFSKQRLPNHAVITWMMRRF
jgi:hypothetical protein